MGISTKKYTRVISGRVRAGQTHQLPKKRGVFSIHFLRYDFVTVMFDSNVFICGFLVSFISVVQSHEVFKRSNVTHHKHTSINQGVITRGLGIGGDSSRGYRENNLPLTFELPLGRSYGGDFICPSALSGRQNYNGAAKNYSRVPMLENVLVRVIVRTY